MSKPQEPLSLISFPENDFILHTLKIDKKYSKKVEKRNRVINTQNSRIRSEIRRAKEAQK